MSKEDARILLPGLGTYPAWTGVALLEAIGHGAGQQEYVYDAGLNDSGSTRSNIAGSVLNYSASKTLQRSGDFGSSLTGGNRYTGNSSGGVVTTTQAFLVLPLVKT